MSRLRTFHTKFRLVECLDVADRETTDSHRAIAAAIRDDISDIVLITAQGRTAHAREQLRALTGDVL